MPPKTLSAPLVSVLMPTFKHAPFIHRAVESLLAQRFADWELVIVDDGSPDDTAAALAPLLAADSRLRYIRRERNGGLGAALNDATAAARGRYLAYLPSDDLFYPDHLQRLADLLESRPDASLAFGGLRYQYQKFGPAPGVAEGEEVDPRKLRLVQVMHRRGHEAELPWPTRAERESDAIEGEQWARLAELGAVVYGGAISCEWVDHLEQRTKLVATHLGGLSRYRGFYGLERGEWLNWQPTHGPRVDERRRYGRFAVERALPQGDGLTILVVGELGFNPERLMALEERGHRLAALWVPRPEIWDTAGPLPYGNILSIPYDGAWKDRVRELRPDVIYGLLNWQAVALIDEVLGAGLGIPAVFHFKEGPFICHERGLWPALVRVLRRSVGHVFIDAEMRDWFRLALGDMFDPATTMLLDGDLPKADWFTDEWAPKLSAQDGQIHTVCPGRPLGIDGPADLARNGIHIHFYGEHFQQWFPNWTRSGVDAGYLHLHPTVEHDQWVRELSQYDAAWLHVFDSRNGGDLRRAMWDDLNLPARLGTYAAAGLPWIMRDNRASAVAMQRIADEIGAAVAFHTYEDLAAQLRDRPLLDQRTANMRAARMDFAFDTHADELIALFRRAIAR